METWLIFRMTERGTANASTRLSELSDADCHSVTWSPTMFRHEYVIEVDVNGVRYFPYVQLTVEACGRGMLRIEDEDLDAAIAAIFAILPDSMTIGDLEDWTCEEHRGEHDGNCDCAG